MFHLRNLLDFLRRTSLITLLILSIIMLLHVFIMTIGTSFMLWPSDSTPFDAGLLTFLYYVIPIIALLSFYLMILQLSKLESSCYNAKSRKRVAHSKNYSSHSKMCSPKTPLPASAPRNSSTKSNRPSAKDTPSNSTRSSKSAAPMKKNTPRKSSTSYTPYPNKHS